MPTGLLKHKRINVGHDLARQVVPFSNALYKGEKHKSYYATDIAEVRMSYRFERRCDDLIGNRYF